MVTSQGQPNSFEVGKVYRWVFHDWDADTGHMLESIEDYEGKEAWLPRSTEMTDEEFNLGRSLNGLEGGES